jgi:hypothetical protein
MAITPISVILDNVPGALSNVSEILDREGVNILKSHGFRTKEIDVLAVETPDHGGGMNAVLKPLKDAGINARMPGSPAYCSRDGRVPGRLKLFRQEPEQNSNSSIFNAFIRDSNFGIPDKWRRLAPWAHTLKLEISDYHPCSRRNGYAGRIDVAEAGNCHAGGRVSSLCGFGVG